MRIRNAPTSAAAVAEQEPSPPEHSHGEITSAHRSPSRRGLNRQTRVDKITEALRSSGKTEVLPVAPLRKLDISHANVRSRDGRREHRDNAKRLRTPRPAESREAALQRILASCIKHQAAITESMEAEWMASFHLTPAELALLEANGYTLDDLRAWVEIVSTPQPLQAGTALAKHTAACRPQSVPIFVLLHVLRRAHFNARAFRILVQQISMNLEHRRTLGAPGKIGADAIFMIFTRLLRHAREVWPRAMENLSDILLINLPLATSDGKQPSVEQLEALTYMLNKAMRLIAIPTAVEPFKDNIFQEASIVRILKFMAEHDPPLEINREGYRAVILLQLAQRKTEREWQWAELKALSWPPWKEERTAMDADIQLEEHGVSKAGETLARMREAGYAPLDWEKVAAIYTGWDTDRTPTTQTLVLLGTGGERFKSGAATWTARITTTRTAQEAWACYLAYEEEKLPPDQDVYLAVFRKLHKEERRNEKPAKSKGRQSDSRRVRRLYPGDTQEVEPLPPSTHLYTYTRTLPPTVDGLYRQLRDRGIVLKGYCLAFLVANAASLKLGIEYLLSSSVEYPDIRGLVSLDAKHDLSSIPMPVFGAFIGLLSCFSNTPLSSALPDDSTVKQRSSLSTETLQNQNLNIQHALVHAIELLKQRRPLFRPTYNSILSSLGHQSSLANIKAVFVVRRLKQEASEPLKAEEEKWQGAITAYRLVRRVLSLMRDVHLDLDVVGFQGLCWATENAVWSCWRIVLSEAGSGARVKAGKPEPLVREATAWVRSSSHAVRLKGEFRVLVGDANGLADAIEGAALPCLQVPRLLEVPNPALLHAYIRALGWLADYDGLLETVRWMVEYRTELAERRARDRNGEVVMRRALVALRVFLERSWIVPGSESGRVRVNEISDADIKDPGVRAVMRRHLLRLERPASAEVVDAVRGLVEGVGDWEGWASDEEVERYCENSRFGGFEM